MNSRRKGAAGERELANKLKDYGCKSRRGQWLVTLRMNDFMKLYGDKQ